MGAALVSQQCAVVRERGRNSGQSPVPGGASEVPHECARLLSVQGPGLAPSTPS